MARFKNSANGKLAKYNWTRVNETGSYAEDYDDETPLEIKQDSDGYKYVDDGWDNTYIDEAVLMGFGKKLKFSESEGYIVRHIDGDLNNTSKDNLEWKIIIPNEATKTGHVFFYGETIGKDGSIVIKAGKEIEKGQFLERWFDDDVNASWFFENPIMVTYEVGGGCQWHEPDEYMARAGYVNGDKSSLKNPVVLHRDHDVSNYHSDNLEWVESDDPRYIVYDKKRKDRQKELIKQHNQDLGYSIPKDWPQ